MVGRQAASMQFRGGSRFSDFFSYPLMTLKLINQTHMACVQVALNLCNFKDNIKKKMLTNGQ